MFSPPETHFEISGKPPDAIKIGGGPLVDYE